MAKEVAEDYASSLADLTMNSKPLINMLTILAEENADHAGAIVDTVEKHLEKVHPDIKLPVLYLVDSIVKNVGGEYVQKFAQVIVNMFTKTFKQVDEKTRSQMYKLRETWFEVFPATKLYQLDVKVNLIDPAWPIQQYNIHVNPNFLKKPVASTSSTPAPVTEEDKIKNILARKEEELLKLKQKKIEMEQEQARRQRELVEKTLKKGPPVSHPILTEMPPQVPPINGIPPVVTSVITTPVNHPETVSVPVKQRLGPPVSISKNMSSTGGARIAPVSGAMLAGVRRDPRLARHLPPAQPPPQPPPPPPPPPTITPNAFDTKPVARPDRITKRKNVITIDVQPDATRREPRLDRRLKAKQAARSRDDDRDKGRAHTKIGVTKRYDEKNARRAENDRPNPKKIEDVDKSNTKTSEEPRTEIARDETTGNDNERTASNMMVDDIVLKFPVVDPKKINKLPPIPKITNRDNAAPKPVDNADEPVPSPTKKRKELSRGEKKKKRDKDRSNSVSPEKKPKSMEAKDNTKESKQKKQKKEESMEVDAEKPIEPEIVTFKELKNYHKERYMRRNKEKSESPDLTSIARSLVAEEKAPPASAAESEAPSLPEILENRDVDLRIFQPAVTEAKAAAAIVHKRPSTEAIEVKPKKNKMEKFDILFGDEDVDLRQLPQVEEVSTLVPPLVATSDILPTDTVGVAPKMIVSPMSSPKEKDWADVKENSIISLEETKKPPSQLDLVRAKLAEATKGTDRLGRPLLFHSTSGERRRTISSEDTDLRPTQNPLDSANDKESIKIIMSQAEEQFKVGNIDKEEYKTLMLQVLQLNERLKLKEAKQRESLEVSKRKLQKAAQISDEELDSSVSPNRSPHTDYNTFGDIDERIAPLGPTASRDNSRFEAPILNMPSNQLDIGALGAQDSDLRVPVMPPNDLGLNMMIPAPPRPPNMLPMMMNPYPGPRRGLRPWSEDFNGPRMRGRHPIPPFSRGKFGQWNSRFEPRMPALPRPMIGIYQGECPLRPYNRSHSPPPLGVAAKGIPPTDFRLIEYIDQDPMKTIDIDGVPREIRFYGNTAIIMLDWDDPREIKFLPGTRRITFDNKDSVVLGFNEDYMDVNIDDHDFRIKYGAPTRELYINERWYECFFGGPPMGIIVDGKPKLVQLEGPPPQVDIGKEKRTNLVAGKINMIVDGNHMFPVFLDAKPQKFNINGIFITLRFVDSLKTVLINEKPFKIEFGGLPKPIFIGKQKHFIRFSVLPRNVRPGHIKIENMEGRTPDERRRKEINNADSVVEKTVDVPMEMDESEEPKRPEKIPSPDGENSNPGGLDMLASLMPSSMAPASQFSAGYSLAEPLMPTETNKIPGLDTPADENPPPSTSVSFVNDLFAKLVASGIVQVPTVETKKPDDKPAETKDAEEPKTKPSREDKSNVKPVNLLRPETLRVKQPALVARLYGGMQCSGCGARFPPEHTVRYSQHLDWHFRQNRRERDSARRAHSRHWHYDLSDWVQYEEIEDLEEREKSWFETGGAEGEIEGIVEVSEGEAPSVPAGAPEEEHCALCGDKFDQFYNEDKEEWHLRKAVRHEDKNYHPLCFEDYKESLTKEEPSDVVEINDTVIDEQEKNENIEETIEIKDVDDINSQSDNESVVEVIESESQKDDSQEPLEIPDDAEDTEMKEAAGPEQEVVNADLDDDGDEDDVVLKADPVEEVVVDDDADTDDETQAERAERDRLAAIDFSKIKVKVEPLDPDDEPVVTAEQEAMRAGADTTHTTVLSSIDGNVQLEASVQPPPALPLGGIRINITKPISNIVTVREEERMLEDMSADDEPLPPGEEPELTYTLKPTLEGVSFSKQPPVQRGSELSGLCSIM